jgi:hypothetical protein
MPAGNPCNIGIHCATPAYNNQTKEGRNLPGPENLSAGILRATHLAREWR